MKEIKLNESFPITKTEQSALADKLITTVLDGEVEAIESVVKAKSMIEALTKFVNDSRIKDYTLREIEKNGKETSWNGAKLQLKELGVKYDYSDCNDPVYSDLFRQKTEIEKKLKERETFLKALVGRMTIVNESTGEVSEILPPVRMATQGYTITFSK